MFDRYALEYWLAVTGEAVISGHAKVQWDDPFAEEPVRQVTGNVRLGLARQKIPASRLDNQG